MVFADKGLPPGLSLVSGTRIPATLPLGRREAVAPVEVLVPATRRFRNLQPEGALGLTVVLVFVWLCFGTVAKRPGT